MVRVLIHKADILFLTETKTADPETIQWQAVNVQAPATSEGPRRAGGFAVLFTEHIKFKHIANYSTANFKAICCPVNGTPVIAAYIRPTTSDQELNQLFALADHCLRGPGVLVGTSTPAIGHETTDLIAMEKKCINGRDITTSSPHDHRLPPSRPLMPKAEWTSYFTVAPPPRSFVRFRLPATQTINEQSPYCYCQRSTHSDRSLC